MVTVTSHDGNADLASGSRDTVKRTSTPVMGPEMLGSSPSLPTTPQSTHSFVISLWVE